MKRIRQLLELIRFSHTLFAMPFALWSAVMAWTTPGPAGVPPAFRWRDLVGIVLCMVTARSAAMAFNRWADRRLDAANPRTAGRHLPAGILDERSVVLFTIAMAAGFLASTLLFLPNYLPLLLAPLVLLFLLVYSYTKRFTMWCHFWLGASLMLAPVSAWIAVRGLFLWETPSDLAPALLLGLAVLTWVAGFDIIYACQDIEFDRRERLYSIPALMGARGALRLAAACHAATLLLLALLPQSFPQLGLAHIYNVALASVAVLLVIEHWLVKPDDLSRVNVAFFHVNVAVSIALFLAGSIDVLT
ncbi:MAG: 4-hydroxybenzoate octaprenyltransferase [Pirellulaceae bacterium]|nr:MAG: 4-hydroxybenzoate octaprenyltransferase [Pirellulaceae bacterium]